MEWIICRVIRGPLEWIAFAIRTPCAFSCAVHIWFPSVNAVFKFIVLWFNLLCNYYCACSRGSQDKGWNYFYLPLLPFNLFLVALFAYFYRWLLNGLIECKPYCLFPSGKFCRSLWFRVMPNDGYLDRHEHVLLYQVVTSQQFGRIVLF